MVAVAVVAIALGDAFRHGADAALVYRSCAAIGDPAAFGRRFAHAESCALAAMVALTAGGGWLAEHVGFAVAWVADIGLASVGLALAASMTEMPATSTDDDATHSSVCDALRSRVRWPLVVRATLVLTLASCVELIVQAAPPAGTGADVVASVIAASLLLEAVGAWLVARGAWPVSLPALDATLSLAALGLLLLLRGRALALVGLALIFLASGAAPAIRAALLQDAARDDERATAASAAGALDVLAKGVGLPLAAWLLSHG